VKNKLKITTRESAIRSILREALATTPETTPHGRDDKQMLTTVPSRLPISPSDQAATQLHTQRPPIEDPDFVPANQVELGKAMDALSTLVPDGMVEKFYRQFVAMVDNAAEEDAEEQAEEGG